MSGAARRRTTGRREETRVPSSGGTSRGTHRLAGRTKRALGWAIVLSSVGLGALFVARGKAPGHGAPDTEDQGPVARTHFGPGAESAPPSLLAPAGPEDVAKRVALAMADWRNAILVRNAGPVIKLQAAFAEAPSMFMEALKTSAASDENERVRAFSTRELGKLRRADLEPTFQALLDDKSRFVRKNAAWALAELSAGDEGRTAARNAQGGLRRLVQRDPAEEVRAAARDALNRME
jgi:hypothetical protein